YDALLLGLTTERAVLHERADQRVDAMIAAGFLDEVRALYARGYAPSLPALSSLGYRELGESLRGERPLDDAVQATKWATHRFIRRQLTWFRGEPGIQWFEVTRVNVADDVSRLAARWLTAPELAAHVVRSA
ncbi:MAG: tRNA (adenosine(37)-N6)-dimethylallyltransferase MiaA, partial [Chloroflexota bacterium]|nr:tRNA (adenosine(37)-N6)-dimethylallyltransferase MiaA [Chloroflexota bacterium]